MKFIFWSKFILILLLAMISIVNVEAQKKSTKKKDFRVYEGDKLFALEEYVKAAELYKKAYDDDNQNHEALYKLAESYRLQFDYFNAQKYYELATKNALKEYPLSRFYYGVMLKDNGNYVEAKEQFAIFRKEFKLTDLKSELFKEKAIQEAKGCDMALEELKKPQRDYSFKSLPIPINSPQNDYSPVILENDTVIAITSARMESRGKRESGVGGSLTDLYRFKKGTEEVWSEDKAGDGFNQVNTPFNESSGSVTGDRSKFYFTRCDEKIKNGNLIEYNCSVYVMNFKDGKWDKPIRLNDNVNKKGQWNAQPAISTDGRVLFFVSRRPGGIGMNDIWYSTSAAEEKWSPAINMGDHVNTLFHEVAPKYYGNEKTLFFSSNGREGFGGLDVYFVHEDQLDSVKNIGLPFNSNRDDQDFVLGTGKGYLSSNRDGGIGNFDIYGFNIESKESLIAYINNDSIKNVQSISVVGQLTNSETKDPAKDVPVILADEESNKLKNTTTNDFGVFKFDNLSTTNNYKVLLDEPNAKITKKVEYVVEKVEVKGSSKKVSRVHFDNIYFDFNKHDLKPEANIVLDKLYNFYSKHPEIQIELSANTDSLGSLDYNKALSKSRGNNAMNYLVSKGLDKAALVVNAQGEKNPVATNNTELGRQLNRRVEFYIIGGEGYNASVTSSLINPNERALYYVAKQFNMSVDDLEKYLKHEKMDVSPVVTQSAGTQAQTYSYYTIQPKNTLFSVARLYGMGVDELMALNNIPSNKPSIAIGQRIKVKIRVDLPGDGYYQVKAGETLSSIASKFGISVEDLVKLNAMEGYLLEKYMILKVK